MVKARTEYKNTVRKFNFQVDRKKSMKLINAKLKNAKEYWRLLKESVSQPKPKSLSAKDFDLYYKSVNNPEDPFFQAKKMCSILTKGCLILKFSLCLMN